MTNFFYTMKWMIFVSCAGKLDYISIRGKPWDRGMQWLSGGVKSKHKGTSPLCCKVTASAKPEMKPDSFNKMSISPRTVECFKDLGKIYTEEANI